MRLIPQRSSLFAHSFASTKVLVSVVLILVVVLAAVFAAAYYFLVIAVPTRIYEQAPPPTSSTPAPWSTITPTPSTVPPTSTPSLPSSPAPATPTPSTFPKYSLSEAISAGYIEANITGVSGVSIFDFDFGTRGASSGDCIILHLRRLVNSTIEIEPIPMGTLLVPNSASAQTMTVLKLQGITERAGYHKAREKIILDTKDPVQYLFSAYCVDFTKDNPTDYTLFTQSGVADANVLKIFNAISQLPKGVATVTAIQTAVFVVTNDVSLSELSARFTSNATEIQSAKTILQTAGIDTSNKRLVVG